MFARVKMFLLCLKERNVIYICKYTAISSLNMLFKIWIYCLKSIYAEKCNSLILSVAKYYQSIKVLKKHTNESSRFIYDSKQLYSFKFYLEIKLKFNKVNLVNLPSKK